MNVQLQSLQAEVQSRLLRTHIVQAVQEGSIRRSQYVAYLADVYAYACHSSQVIARAGSRLVLTHPELASYLFVHAGEELGHDRWAAHDLADLGVGDEVLENLAPSSACLRMIGLEYLYAAHLNPVGLFGWMFMLETLGGAIGGSVAAGLDKALRLEGRALKFLQGHAEADTHHAADLFRIVDQHVRSEGDLAAFHRMAEESAALYESILETAFEARQD